MAQTRWVPPADEIERWDNYDRGKAGFRSLKASQSAWKRLARCLLEMIDDTASSIRSDLPDDPAILERFDTLERSLGRERHDP